MHKVAADRVTHALGPICDSHLRHRRRLTQRSRTHVRARTHTDSTWAVGGVLTLAFVTIIVPDPILRTHCAEAGRSETQGPSHPQVLSVLHGFSDHSTVSPRAAARSSRRRKRASSGYAFGGHRTESHRHCRRASLGRLKSHCCCCYNNIHRIGRWYIQPRNHRHSCRKRSRSRRLENRNELST